MNFGRVEAQVNVYLNQYPELKKLVKRCYQKCIYVFSKKEKSSGKIIRLSPDNKKEYFFGYYDKTPWDRIGKHVLCMCADDTSKKAESDKPAEILLIDSTCQTAKTIAETSAWNVQQGCMLQWLGPTFEEEIIFNDFRNGQFCGVILNVKNGNERIISRPVYAVSLDGTTALTLDFSRLHRLRYGYGYPNLEDSTKNEKLPDKTCIWKINLLTGEVEA